MTSDTEPQEATAIHKLRSLLASAKRPPDLSWASDICRITRILVHSFVIAPVDRDLMREALAVIDEVIGTLSAAPDPTGEIGPRLANIRERRKVLDCLLATEATG